MVTPRRLFLLLAALIVLVAMLFRFSVLGLKAAHHDEGVNYAFTKKLVEKSVYHYNHTAYHGPFLYFVGAPAAAVAGYSKVALRFTPALFGLLTVILALLLRRVIGDAGALFGAALLAVSPADVYFGRTFIHEVYFAFSLVLMLWAFLEAGRQGRALAIVAFWISWAIAFATKETAAFHVIVMAPAVVVCWLVTAYGKPEEPFAVGPLFGRPVLYPFIWGMGITVSLWVLLFTSFLTNPQGMVDFFKAYIPWFETGVKKATHVKVWYYFPELIVTYYWPAVPFAAWAVVRGVWKRRPRTLALSIVALGLLGLYSVIPYKTPWCLLTMGVAFVLLGADGFGDLWRALPRPWGRGLLAAVAVAALLAYGAYSVRLNFLEFDFNHNQHENVRQYEIIYVQTVRGYEQMFDDLHRIAAQSGKGRKLPIHLSAGSKNPARLYLHKYRKVKVGRGGIDKPIKASVVFVRNKEKAKYAEHYDGEYQLFGTYPVFPGWNVNLMVRENLWQELQAAGIAPQANPSS